MGTGELAGVLREARAALAAATEHAEAAGLPATVAAFGRMREAWLAELDAHAVLLERLRGTDVR